MNDQRFLVLVEQMIAGDLDDDRRRSLEGALLDPARRRQLAHLLAVDGALLEHAQGRGLVDRAVSSTRLPAQALSQGRARPSRRTVRPRRHSRRRHALPALVAVAALAAVVVGVVLVALPDNASPQIPLVAQVVVAGPSAQMDRDGLRTGLVAGDGLVAGSRVWGPADLQLADGSALRLEAEADLILHGERQHHLARGRCRATVAPDATRPFVITTPDAEARVLGTVFDLAVDDTGSRVRVLEGQVAFVVGDAPAQVVSAGESATSGPPPAPVPSWSAEQVVAAGWDARVDGDDLRPVPFRATQDANSVAQITGDPRILDPDLRLGQGTRIVFTYSLPAQSRSWLVLGVHEPGGRWRGNWQWDTELLPGVRREQVVRVDELRRKAGNGEIAGGVPHLFALGTHLEQLEGLILHDLRFEP